MSQVFVFFIVFSSFQLVQAYSASSDEVLRKTQESLADRAQRNEIISQDPKAQEVDANIKKLMGESADAAYESAIYEFLPYILELAGGDTDKAQKLIAEDPEKFLKNLPPHLRNKVSELALKSPLNKKKP